MNSEVQESLRIIKVINEHLAEVPECTHDLKSIMSEALENKIMGNGLPIHEIHCANRTDDVADRIWLGTKIVSLKERSSS